MLCVVNGFGYVWSGGVVGYFYSDLKGLDVFWMIWVFVVREFKGWVG